jgi:hypothetical protein
MNNHTHKKSLTEAKEVPTVEPSDDYEELPEIVYQTPRRSANREVKLSDESLYFNYD